MLSSWQIWITGSTNDSKGQRALLGSALSFSLMTVCVKHLGGRIPLTQILLTRAVISLGITYLALKQRKISLWGKSKKLLLVRGLLGTGALLCIFYALAKLPLGTATILQYTYPTFTAIAAWLILKEKIKRRIVFAIIFGWIGLKLVFNPDFSTGGVGEATTLPLVIGLIGALLTALAYICVRKLSKNEHPLVIIYYFPLVSVPIALPFVLYEAVLPNGIEWFWLIGIGIFTQLGQLLVTKGLSLLPATKASAINYAQVLFAILWGVILFDEQLDIQKILGASLVLIATSISLSSRELVQPKN